MSKVPIASATNARNFSAQYLREKQLVPNIVPISHSTLWRWIKDGKFPQPYRLSDRVTAWKLEEVESWLEERQAA